MTCRLFYFKLGNNYGDVMSPWLLNKLGIKFRLVRKQQADTLIIGSIANQANAFTTVLGSGFIRRNDKICKQAQYVWVRGPMSREMLINVGCSAPELYGDAALLLPQFIQESAKEHDVGYIPHYVDYHLIRDGFKVDLTVGGIRHITQQITRCRKVISSSLHGIIAAHAYGIPAAWVKLSDKLSGDGMKFHDHYESVGLKAICSTLENPVFQVPTQINTEHMIPLMRENT